MRYADAPGDAEQAAGHQQDAARGAVEVLARAIALEEARHLAGDQGVENGVDRRHHQEGAAEHHDLRQQRQVGAEEQREERHVEHDALGIEGRHGIGMGGDAPGRTLPRRVLVERLRHRRAQNLDAEIDQVGGAGQLQRGEQLGRGGEHRAQADQGQRHGGEIAGRHPRHRRPGGALALRQGIADDQQHGRAGNDEQGLRRGDEGNPGMEVGHLGAPDLTGSQPAMTLARPARGKMYRYSLRQITLIPVSREPTMASSSISARWAAL